MPIKLIFPLLILLSAVAASAGGNMTCYIDGTIVVRDEAAIKGMVEVPLAAGLLDGTLKVVPAAGTTLLNVEISSARLDNRSRKEIETLTEQRQRMEDRLRALAIREEIFKSAAKSQSGKAPRKTKSNPDPMQAIRQGTDFAIAQLESVYTTRRKTDQEINRIDARIAAARKSAHSGESSARISVTPARGRVTIRYATSERAWLPFYDMHLAGDGFARLQFSARIMRNFDGYLLRISPGSLAENATAATFPVSGGGSAIFASYRFPLSEENYGTGIYNYFSARITNSGKQHLPAGEAGLYKSGAYLGKFRFEGLSSGRSRVISMGDR
ncbi:MAG: hypothetical protein PHD54_07205 [Desulfuromonadaceae bacterium]|nr:hypothetical protein [Desulfuromonadaceae bacterium]